MKTYGPFKLSRRSYLLSYDIHSWIGIIGGLVFFICCFSGTLALFERELIVWENPDARTEVQGEGLGVDELYRKALAGLPAERGAIFVELPTPWNGTFHLRASAEGRLHKVYLDPESGESIDSADTTAFAFLTHLHTDLHLPRPFGRYLVGLIGVFMMMALIAGVMAHPNIFKEAFSLRVRRSLRLTFADLHKQLGVWGLVFGMAISFTGALIGLVGIIAPVMVLSAFGGDVQKATEAFSGPTARPSGISAQMRPIGSLIEEVEGRHPDYAVRSMSVRYFGDENAEVAFNLESKDHDRLLSGETHRVSLVTGESVHVSTFGDRGLGTRIFGAVQPVHYGLFGGMGLKLLYFVSGIALSLLIATGSIIWLERRQQSTAGADDRRPRYFWLGRLTTGVCLGLVLASVVAIAFGRFAPVGVEPVFWCTWSLAIVAAFVAPSSYISIRIGGFATAAVLAAVAIADLSMSKTLTPHVVQVDLVLLALALSSAAATTFVPKGGFVRKSRIKQPAAMVQASS